VRRATCASFGHTARRLVLSYLRTRIATADDRAASATRWPAISKASGAIVSATTASSRRSRTTVLVVLVVTVGHRREGDDDGEAKSALRRQYCSICFDRSDRPTNGAKEPGVALRRPGAAACVAALEFDWLTPKKPGRYTLLACAKDARGVLQPKEHDENYGSYVIDHSLAIEVFVDDSDLAA
jgi:hypothetical protein